jgi:hypothetical protein
MALELDDAQQIRHAFAQMAEFTSILRTELEKQVFVGELLDEMLLIWWRSAIANAFAPDIGSMLGKMFGNDAGAD